MEIERELACLGVIAQSDEGLIFERECRLYGGLSSLFGLKEITKQVDNNNVMVMV